ncbi:hypothetical protein HZA96_00890 [Candidatus Woesearchaeota archaeon]|nr:hypothetical protein [Candidatus Woesearchaeota archaeon]
MKKIHKAFLFILTVIALAALALFVAYLQNNNTDSDQKFSDFVGEAFKGIREPKMLKAYDETKVKKKLNIDPKIAAATANNNEKEIAKKILKRGNKISIFSSRIDQMNKVNYCEATKKVSSWSSSSINKDANTAIGHYSGCYDPTGDDLKKAGAVFSYDYYSEPISPNAANTFEFDKIKIPSNQCKIMPDKCKTENLPFIYEAYCDQYGKPKHSAAQDCRQIFGNQDYICKKGACVLPQKPAELPEVPVEPETPKLKPDLVVETIYPTIFGKQCINSFYFKICNKGEAAVEKEFFIEVSANSYKKEIKYLFVDYPKLAPAQCTDYFSAGKLNIIGFNVLLETTADVTVNLDSLNDLEEADETNNQKTAAVYSGDGYIYDPNNPKEFCDTTCYDSDGSDKAYFVPGELIFKYNDKLYSSKEDESFKDKCVDEDFGKKEGVNENSVELKEVYCKPIVKYQNTDKFSNPYGNKWVDCRDLNKPDNGIFHKCQEGACKVIPKDNLQCLDYEDGQDAFFKGYIDYTSIDGKNEKIYDFCVGTEVLRDVFCEDDYLRESAYINCYETKTADGKGHVCEDGKCVATDIDKEACTGPKSSETDPYTLGKITVTKLLGETMPNQDWCSNFGDSVVEVYCDGKYKQTKEYSCSKDGAGCVNGVCVKPDDSKKKCEEFNDAGLDFYKGGDNKYATAFGENLWANDYCIDNDKLIEVFCEGNEIKFTDPYSCKAEEKECVNNACKSKDPALESCKDDKDGGKVVDVKGKTKAVDQYGDTNYEKDYCVQIDENPNPKCDGETCPTEEVSWDAETNGVKEFYCDGKTMKSEDILCAAGKVCKYNECIKKDPALENCVETENNIIVTDAFGEENYYLLNGCSSWDGVSNNTINSCDGKKLKQETIICQQGTECAYDYNQGKNTCVVFDESKKSCKLSEDGQWFITTNKFGYEDNYFNSASCGNKGDISIPYCNGNEIDWNKKPCDAGYKCTWNDDGKEQCMPYDESKIKCEVVTEGVEVMWINAFGKTEPYKKGCAYGSAKGQLKIPYCDGKFAEYNIAPCESGYLCNPKTDSCQKGDFSLDKCIGPAKEQLDIKKKEKVIKTNEFGEAATLEDKFTTEDVCVADVEPKEDPEHKKLAQFYCDGKDFNIKLVDCPNGTKCKDGACA